MLEIESGVFTGRALKTHITDVTDLSTFNNNEYVIFSVEKPSFVSAEILKGMEAS